MSGSPLYFAEQPTREEVDATKGARVLNFGTNWCGFCRASWPHVQQALQDYTEPVEHQMIEDGSGRKLGRSFGVKLWPTLIFLRNGVEVARLVRPVDAASVAEALAQLQA
ncbi:MAG: thioredoxin family protein [Burkholderiaceae bacterium]